MRISVVTLRPLCGEKSFAIEKTPGGKRFRLIDLEIGHAVMHPERGRPGFTLKEAVVYLRGVDRRDPGS